MATSDPIVTRQQAADDGALAVPGEVTPAEARRCRWALARLARSHAALRVVLAELVDTLAMAVDTEQGTAPNPAPRPVERSPAPPTP